MSIYHVVDHSGESHLVQAKSQRQATNHVANKLIVSATVCKATDVGRLMTKGVKLEDAAEPAEEGGQ